MNHHNTQVRKPTVGLLYQIQQQLTTVEYDTIRGVLETAWKGVSDSEAKHLRAKIQLDKLLLHKVERVTQPFTANITEESAVAVLKNIYLKCLTITLDIEDLTILVHSSPSDRTRSLRTTLGLEIYKQTPVELWNVVMCMLPTLDVETTDAKSVAEAIITSANTNT